MGSQHQGDPPLESARGQSRDVRPFVEFGTLDQVMLYLHFAEKSRYRGSVIVKDDIPGVDLTRGLGIFVVFLHFVGCDNQAMRRLVVFD